MAMAVAQEGRKTIHHMLFSKKAGGMDSKSLRFHVSYLASSLKREVDDLDAASREKKPVQCDPHAGLNDAPDGVFPLAPVGMGEAEARAYGMRPRRGHS